MGFFYNGRLSKAFTPKENQEFSNVYLEIELQISSIMINAQGNCNMWLKESLTIKKKQGVCLGPFSL